MKKIGIISDTHGLLRSEILEILKDCDCIINAKMFPDAKLTVVKLEFQSHCHLSTIRQVLYPKSMRFFYSFHDSQ